MEHFHVIVALKFFCFQDVEEGFVNELNTEEAIKILVKSYMTSKIGKETQKHVEEIIDSVSSVLIHTPSQNTVLSYHLIYMSRLSYFTASNKNAKPH